MLLNVNKSKKSSAKLKWFFLAMPILTLVANIGIKVDFNVRVEKKFDTHTSTTSHINDSLNELEIYNLGITAKGTVLFQRTNRNE